MNTEIIPDEDTVSVECRLDAPMAKVWRALTTPDLAADWLNATHEQSHPTASDTSFEIVEAVAFSRVVYRWSDRTGERPSESLVTVEIEGLAPNLTGFRLTHTPPQPRLVAANTNLSMALAA